MTVRCSICRLGSEKLAAVDAALRENMPLDELLRRTGLSRSALWRHGRHAVKAEGAATPKAVSKAKTAVPAPVEPTLPAPVVKAPEPEPLDTESKRRQADSRLEMLFSEAMSGLEDAKRPITIDKGDGTEVTVPPDLRARAAFIRVGQGIVDSSVKLHHLDQAPSLDVAVFANVILLPKLSDPDLRPAESPGLVIDAVPERLLTDSETPPDGEKHQH